MLVTFGWSSAHAAPQLTFSIDYRGPTIASGFTPGDILTQIPGGSASTLSVSVPSGAGGLNLVSCAQSPGADACVEVDALSYGNDVLIDDRVDPLSEGSITARRWWFSVDEWARGRTGSASAPNVASEGDNGPAHEASADLFVDLILASGPLEPPTIPGGLPEGCRGAMDGNGLFSANLVRYPGLGLVEPDPPAPASACPTSTFPCPWLGDDLDAVDVDGPPGSAVFFSLDDGFIDPLLGIPNTNSALDNSSFITITGADVIRRDLLSGQATIFARASELGLNKVGPDDLDALILRDLDPGVNDPQNQPGDGSYQLARRPYAWNFAAPFTKDMVLFSVRRGSAVIGMPDSIWGRPIEPGDVLIPPVTPNYIRPDGQNAVGGTFPGVFMPAEYFGLITDRADLVPGNEFGDDVDALDIAFAVLDCPANANGVEDAIDLVYGTSLDQNFNGVPDECDLGSFSTYCTGGTTTNGCVATISGVGVPDANAGSGFLIQVSAVEGQKAGLIFYGLSGPLASAWGTGSSYLCVKAPTQRMTVQNSGGNAGSCNGTLSEDWNLFITVTPGALGVPFAGGECVWAQGWFRDPAAPKTTNLSSALEFVVQP